MINFDAFQTLSYFLDSMIISPDFTLLSHQDSSRFQKLEMFLYDDNINA